MNIIELQTIIDEEGIGSTIDKSLINSDDIDDVVLADMIAEAKLLLDEITTYVSEKIEQCEEVLEKDSDDYCRDYDYDYNCSYNRENEDY